jgi:double-stranded uracil-DNA glycosylase
VVNPSEKPTDALVPDLLEGDLRLVLCGTAPSRRSLEAQAYYAHPQNRFWPTLFAAGLISQALQPREYHRLLEWKIGLTDVAKGHSGLDSQIPKAGFKPLELREKLRIYQPERIGFTSKRAASEALGVATGKLEYGLQTRTLEGVQVWVLPSTSPLAANFFVLEPWLELAQDLAREDFKRDLERPKT